jgi:hypothetical protein
LLLYPIFRKYSKLERDAFNKINHFFRVIKSFILFDRLLKNCLNSISSYINFIEINKLKEEISIINSRELSLFNMYRDVRVKLSGVPDSLEIKTTVKGIIQ